MTRPYFSERKTRAISLSVLLLGLAVLSFTGVWWPWLMAVIGLSTIVKHMLRGKFYDAGLSLIIFGGIVVTTGWNIGGQYFVPVVLILASIYMIIRAFFQPDIESEAESEEEQNLEISEDESEQ